MDAKIITKVKMLLERTTENGCTEAEATAATAQAHRIMLRHKLELRDVEEAGQAAEQVKAWDDPLDDNGRTMPTWKGQLAMVLARPNGCSIFRNGGRIKIIGRASDANTLRYLYAFVTKEMARMSTRYAGNGRTWLNNWRLGFVNGVDLALQTAEAKERTTYAAETGTSLVVVDQALATINQRHEDALAFGRDELKLKSGRSSRSRHDASARNQGERDGGRVNLSNGGSAQLGGGQGQIN